MTNKTNFELDKFEEFLEGNGSHVKAIGEIGLDGQYAKDEGSKKKQREVFEFLLKLAERKGLPVVVHSRLAIDEVLQVLPSYRISRVLLHWYSGPTEKLELIRDRGYMISIGPSVLYSGRTSEIASAADLNMVLSETDGPVSYHGPFEGQATQPSFVVEVIRKLAELKSHPIDAVRSTIWSNFQKLIP